MMKMLESAGMQVLTDQIRTADEDNPKGYYEFERVKKLREGDTAWLADVRGKAVKIVSAHLEYLPAAYRYRIIFMLREMKEILASQQDMLARRGAEGGPVSDEEMTNLYQKHLAQVRAWLADQGNMRVLYLNYNELLQSPQPELQKVSGFLGDVDPQRMLAVIDKNLYRHRH